MSKKKPRICIIAKSTTSEFLTLFFHKLVDFVNIGFYHILFAYDINKTLRKDFINYEFNI